MGCVCVDRRRNATACVRSPRASFVFAMSSVIAGVMARKFPWTSSSRRPKTSSWAPHVGRMPRKREPQRTLTTRSELRPIRGSLECCPEASSVGRRDNQPSGIRTTSGTWQAKTIPRRTGWGASPGCPPCVGERDVLRDRHGSGSSRLVLSRCGTPRSLLASLGCLSRPHQPAQVSVTVSGTRLTRGRCPVCGVGAARLCIEAAQQRSHGDRRVVFVGMDGGVSR